jgi:hypothetical protein
VIIVNQIAASILVLSGAVCGLAALGRPVGDHYANVMSLIAAGLGLWGILSLISVATRESDDLLDEGSFHREGPLDALGSPGRLASRLYRRVNRDHSEPVLSRSDERLWAQRRRSRNDRTVT